MIENNFFKNFIKKIFRYILYLIIISLFSIFIFLAYYVISYKIAESKKTNPPFSLLTAISGSMEPVINKNDIILIKKVNVETLKVGDIITFYPSNNIFAKTSFTHRINEIIKENNSLEFITKGDANDNVDITIVESTDILGKVILVIPKLGIFQNYVVKNGRIIFILFIPSIIFLISLLIKCIKIIKRKKELEDIGEF